jgi:hypothetical protein
LSKPALSHRIDPLAVKLQRLARKADNLPMTVLANRNPTIVASPNHAAIIFLHDLSYRLDGLVPLLLLDLTFGSLEMRTRGAGRLVDAE